MKIGVKILVFKHPGADPLGVIPTGFAAKMQLFSIDQRAFDIGNDIGFIGQPVKIIAAFGVNNARCKPFGIIAQFQDFSAYHTVVQCAVESKILRIQVEFQCRVQKRNLIIDLFPGQPQFILYIFLKIHVPGDIRQAAVGKKAAVFDQGVNVRIAPGQQNEILAANTRRLLIISWPWVSKMYIYRILKAQTPVLFRVFYSKHKEMNKHVHGKRKNVERKNL